MKITSLRLMLTSLLASVMFLGCKKSDDNYFKDQYQNVMRENALLDGAFNDVLKISENILMNNNNAKIDATGAPLGCITDIDTVVTGPTSKTYTINFSSSCTSYDGKIRSGTLIAELNGTNYNTSGATLTIRLNNFYINGNKFEGKIISTNLGSGSFKIEVTDDPGTGYAKLVLENGDFCLWKTTHKRTIYEGNSDQIIINNKYKINTFEDGAVIFEGTSSDYLSYKMTLLEELVMDYSCTASGNLRYPIDGQIEYTLANDTKRTINYGDGVCDQTATMSTNGVYKDFSLY